MALQQASHNTFSHQIKSELHTMHWRDSIATQLQSRKSIEQSPFDEVISVVNTLLVKMDQTVKENNLLVVRHGQLEQDLLNFQQTLLAGGSDAAKTIISKMSKTLNDDKFAATQSTSSEHTIEQLKAQLEKAKLENEELKSTLDKTERALKITADEYKALSMINSSLDKKYNALLVESEAMKKQILAAKLKDAERLNNENEKVIILQQERARRELEATVKALQIVDNFDPLDDADLQISVYPSCIPNAVEFTFDAHEHGTSAVKWYSWEGVNDCHLATGGQDRKVKLWKVSNSVASPICDSLHGSNNSITSIDVESDAILASSSDMATRVWSLTNQRLIQTHTGHSAKVSSAKFLGKPNSIVSGAQDRTIKIWDVNRGACTKTYFPTSMVMDLAYGNNQIISAHFDKKIRGWDLHRPNDNEAAWQMIIGDSKVLSVDISKDGTKVVCLLRDNVIKCLDIRSLEVLQTYTDEKFKVGDDNTRINFSGDGQLIACGSNDGSFFIWDVNSARVEKVLKNHKGHILSACWSPDGHRMVSIDNGKKISIWA